MVDLVPDVHPRVDHQMARCFITLPAHGENLLAGAIWPTINEEAIMTSNGAKRWMMHMNAAIAQSDLNSVDPRIESCLREFLEFTMETYGVQFDFNVIDWIHTVASKL